MTHGALPLHPAIASPRLTDQALVEPGNLGHRSMFYTKNDPHDAPDFLKPLRIEREGHFNPAVRCLSM
jgi:hypothetical protein